MERRSSLLSEAEGKYFNYFLNAADFSNGPELRNKYLHGSQVNAEGEDAHFHTYMIALRLTVALVIKMNDDFCLAAAEKAVAEADRMTICDVRHRLEHPVLPVPLPGIDAVGG